jgi:YHS domain-containing protein
MGEAEESALPPVDPVPSEANLDPQPRLMARDPVCGVDVDPASPAGTVEYMGVPYSFCSLTCKSAFELDPARYAG